MKVSVVIPARNEEGVIGDMVTMLTRVFNEHIHQVIVVNDGSTDTTKKIVMKLQKKDKRITLINRKPPHGVGRALRAGLKKVKRNATHILTLDADFTRNIPDLFLFFEKIKDHDGLIGSRYIEPHSLVRYPGFKKFFNRAFHLLVRFFYGVKQKDLTNNFKFYKKSVYESLPLTATDYAINAETGLYAVLMGYDIKELPVTWYARGINMGSSKFKLLSVAPGYLKILFKGKEIANNSTRFPWLLDTFHLISKSLHITS